MVMFYRKKIKRTGEEMTYNLFTLSFTGEWEHLEPEFIKSHFRESLTRIRIAVLIAMFFYSIFGFLDAIIVPDQKLIFWAIRYAVICPIALWVLWFSFRPGFETYAQPCLFFMCLSGGLGIELMVILADPPASYSYYAGIILIFITIYTFIRMRFLWAVACSWLIVAGYEIGAIWIADTPRIMLINNNFFFVSANILCMLAGYSMELNIRKRFFSGFKLEQEKNKVSQINRELDQRVRERTLALSTANEHLTKEIRDRINSEKSRLKLEKELNRKHKLEAIGTLAGGIAHDFNNILAAVIGYSELSLSSLDKNSDEYANTKEVLQAGMRAKDLIRQILTFSRRTEQKMEPVQLGKVVTEALKLIRASIPAGIDIIRDIKSTALIIGDEGELHRIVMNLCTNAYHAMENEKGTIEVRVEDTVLDQEILQAGEPVAPGKYVILTVGDTGQGMTPDVLEKVFDPFFTTKSVDHGTGMGLSVVHGIVKQYNGTIRVYSEPGQGTTFVICLPVAPTDSGPDQESVSVFLPGTERIMVVDDEETLVHMVQKYLSSLGYTVKGFNNSLEAAAYFSDHPDQFDLILTDFNMPGLTGLELSEKIQKIRRDIPIVLCTGYSKNITRQRLKSTGIRAFLMKPVTQYALSTTLREILNHG
jgi:signal transduction histidine kinase